MKVTPALFTSAMARAIRWGIKTHTCRVIVPQPTVGNGWHGGPKRAYRWKNISVKMTPEELARLCPYGGHGDLLIPLTTWAAPARYDDTKPTALPHNAKIWTALDSDEKPARFGRSRPGRFMPKWMRKRLPLLYVLDVRVRGIQDMDDALAMSEGISAVYQEDIRRPTVRRPRKDFAFLWDHINADRGYSWKTNPIVWDIHFRAPRLRPS